MLVSLQVRSYPYVIFPFICTEQLLLERNYSDYLFVANSCGTVDGMSDSEEFKATEVRSSYFLTLCCRLSFFLERGPRVC